MNRWTILIVMAYLLETKMSNWYRRRWNYKATTFIIYILFLFTLNKNKKITWFILLSDRIIKIEPILISWVFCTLRLQFKKVSTYRAIWVGTCRRLYGPSLWSLAGPKLSLSRRLTVDTKYYDQAIVLRPAHCLDVINLLALGGRPVSNWDSGQPLAYDQFISLLRTLVELISNSRVHYQRF